MCHQVQILPPDVEIFYKIQILLPDAESPTRCRILLPDAESPTRRRILLPDARNTGESFPRWDSATACNECTSNCIGRKNYLPNTSDA